MPLHLSPQAIALRLLLAAVASFLIGLNRDEQGHPAGIRTTMLVCFAAALAMLQVNLLLPLAGKPPTSFATLDLMRLPLGILSGIGFIGAGVILKREHGVTGITTAATLWFVTVLGLLFGGGQLILGSTGSAIGIATLWGLKKVEGRLPREHRASLSLTLDANAPSEADLRRLIQSTGWHIVEWSPTFQPATVLSTLHCTVGWRGRSARSPRTPEVVDRLRREPGILSVAWQE